MKIDIRKHVKTIQISCRCGLPDFVDEIIGCENRKCQKWYHLRCVGVSKGQEWSWVCEKCQLNIPSMWIERIMRWMSYIPSFPIFSFQRSAKAQASLCIVTNSTELLNSRNTKFPYYFSFQRSAKAQVSMCIVTNSTELQNSRNSKFPYYFLFRRIVTNSTEFQNSRNSNFPFYNQQSLRQVCGLS